MMPRTDKEIKELYAAAIHCLLKRNKSDHVIFESEEWENMKNTDTAIMYRNTEEGGFELKTIELDVNLQN